MHKPWIGSIGAAAVVATAVASVVATTVASAGVAPHTNPRTVHVRWTTSGPPLTIGTPACSAAGRCTYPFTEIGTDSGDLEGTHVSAGGSALDPTGTRFAVSRVQIFTGTIRGCGTGTVVGDVTESADARGGTATWTFRAGSGTDGLAGITGHGIGAGAAGAAGMTARIRGVVHCGR